MQANLVIDSKAYGGGKKQTTTITHLRPSQKSHATELATALNALTTNEFVGASVNEINVDISGKPEPTITLGNWELVTSKGYYATITYTGDGNLYVECSNPAYIAYDEVEQANKLTVITSGFSSQFTGKIYSTETDNYSAKVVNFSKT